VGQTAQDCGGLHRRTTNGLSRSAAGQHRLVLLLGRVATRVPGGLRGGFTDLLCLPWRSTDPNHSRRSRWHRAGKEFQALSSSSRTQRRRCVVANASRHRPPVRVSESKVDRVDVGLLRSETRFGAADNFSLTASASTHSRIRIIAQPDRRRADLA